MAFHTVEDGPWPYGVTVSVWPTSALNVLAGPTYNGIQVRHVG
jgi:hypothetical protein